MAKHIKDMNMMSMDMRKCHRNKAVMMLILGLLILANTYWMVVGWDYFIGIVLTLAGIIKLIK